MSPMKTQTSCFNRNFSDDALQIKNIPTVRMRHIMGNSNQSKFFELTEFVIHLVFKRVVLMLVVRIRSVCIKPGKIVGKGNVCGEIV